MKPSVDRTKQPLQNVWPHDSVVGACMGAVHTR
jgi:hypothetical protein